MVESRCTWDGLVDGLAATELTLDELRELDSAASQTTVHGARYPEELEKMTGR